MKQTIYLDNASTTPITNAVFAEMLPYLRDSYGNPSSLHSMGKETKKAINKAREQVARAINAEPNQIFFTSGATSSNNLVLSNFNNILCSRVEHPSIYNHPNCHTMQKDVPLAKQIYDFKYDLVTQMLVNNELGVIYNIKPMVEIAHQMNIPFHCDATQAFGHIPVDVKDLNIDSLSLSGHKAHSAKGTGILYLKEPNKYKPLLYGGGQEKGLYSGTENVAGIVAMGKACELYNYDLKEDNKIWRMMNHLREFILDNIPDVLINSDEGKYETVSNILSVSFKDIEGESLMLLLDRENICVSAGSACHSGSLEPSYVLKDLGVPDDYIYGTIRFSFSRLNTIEEIIEVEQKLKTIIEKLRNIR